MLNAFVAAIIGVCEPGNEAFRNDVDCETVILCGDIAALAVLQQTGLVLAPMSKFHFVGIATSRQC